MSITYSVAEYDATATKAEVTYTNDAGFVHKRTINIPRLEDGSIDEEYYQEILEGQLRGVENKVRVNAVTFVDPNAETSEYEETPTE